MANSIDLLGLAWVFFWGILIITLGFTVVGGIAFWKTNTGGAKTFTLFLQRGDALRIMTVGGIVVAATFLALAGVLDGAAVAAILSGIAGYVLGGLGKSKDDQDNDKS
jgi:hypothetical protein